MPGIISVLLMLLAANAAHAVELEATESDELLFDAQLNSVTFVDQHLGWAVGDRGVIWHTADGGQAWKRQDSPVRCRLESVCFLTPQDGWIVGGAAIPYGSHSRGVVLRTRDGGQRWSVVCDAMLPRLLRIQMFDGRYGWAVGYRSNFFPVGVLRTEDGGRSWSTIPGNDMRSLLCGGFIGPQQGVVAGHDGHVAVVRENGVHKSQVPHQGLANVNQLKLSSDHTGWLAGDGGLILRTGNGGLNWEISESLPRATAQQVDFQAIAAREGHCWIAGSPGTIILHTADAGKNWQVWRTGQRLAIRDLVFVSPLHGWAVGDLGMILRTSDGGATWERQGNGAARAALVGFYAEPATIPPELFTRLAGDEGYLGVVELLARPDRKRAAEESRWRLAERTHDALVLVGANGANAAWNFPRRSRRLQLPVESVVADWDRANDGHGTARMQKYVVRKIRQWRPEVIFTEPASPGGENAISHLVNQIVLTAVQQSGDATMHTDQITSLGLEPWQPKKVFSSLPDEQSGSVSITTATLSKRFGRSLAEQSSIGRSLIEGTYHAGPNVVGFRLLKSDVPGDLARRDFFSGISLQHGGEARRPYFRGAAVDLAFVKRAAQKRRNVQKILDQAESAAVHGGGWFGQIADLTAGLDPQSAGEIMFRLAERYSQSGRQDMAADVLRSLVQGYPQHALAAKADTWLVHYLASGETGTQVQRAAATNVASGSHERESAALALVKQIEQNRPTLYAEPTIRFPLAVAFRRLGMPREAERIFNQLRSSQSGTAWGICAVTEHWLTHARGEPPKPLGHAHLVSAKPYLDGKLDEPMWQGADWLELSCPRGDDDSWPAYVAVNYDHEYLYLALNCRFASDANYETTDLPRTRDAVLEDYDRIDVLIDIDRDYTSAYHLTIDYRGWTHESCFGDHGWDPQWFVAAASDDETWNVEAAIPLAELTAEPIQSGAAWAVGLQRIVPRVGFQSWTKPAAVEVMRENFGILLFQ